MRNCKQCFSRVATALLTSCLLVATLISPKVVADGLTCTSKPDDALPARPDTSEGSRPSLSLPNNGRVSADQMEYKFDQATTILSGNVHIQSETLNMEGESVTHEQKTQTYKVTAPIYQYNQSDSIVFRGEAESAQFENNTLTANQGWVTTCPSGDMSWSLRASTLRLDATRKRGTAKNLVFRLGRMPILYLPWFQFPTTKDRQSGMLAPDLQLQGDGNPDLALPIYLNLAPNFDTTITPRIIFGRGLLTKVDVRHLSHSMQNEAQVSLMPSDRDAVLGANSTNPRPDRWHLGWQHEGYWQGGFGTRVDYTQTSDRNYYRDFGNDREAITKGELRQAVIFKIGRRDWSTSLLMQRFQVLDVAANTPYTILPALDFNWQPVRVGRLKWQFQAGLDNFDRNSQVAANTQQVTGQRLRATPRLVYQVERRYGGVRVDGAYRYRRFDLKNNRDRERHEIGSGLISLDAHLKLVKYSKGTRRYAHFIEPRVLYLWSQYQNQSNLPLFDTTTLPGSIIFQFNENRYTGGDRIQDANRFVIGVANRWQNTATGHQWANLNIATLIRLKPERVSLSQTPSSTANDTLGSLVFELSVKPTASISLGGAWTYNPTTNKTTKLTLGLAYRGSERKIINFQYRDRQKRKRLRGSFYWPLGNNLQLAGSWSRDTKTNTNLERVFGIEYFHCCWKVRIGWRSFLIGTDNTGRSVADKGVFFNFAFRGLGQIRSSSADVYSSSIQGFREPNIWDTK